MSDDDAAIKVKVLRQVEYYFSDESYPFDAYLKGKADDAGFVDLSVVCAFKKMQSFTTDEALVAAALVDSDVVALDEEKKKLKRKHCLPEEDPNKARTCHVSGFGVAATPEATEAAISTQMGKFGAVESVRALRNLTNDARQLDGSAFVVFKEAGDAEGAVGCNGSVMGGRKVLIFALPDWFARLGKKRVAMSKKKDQKADDLKNGIVRTCEGAAKTFKPFVPTLGCVIKFEKLDTVEGCDRELLKETCEVGGRVVRYVEFERAVSTEGYCRLDGAVAADLHKEIAKDGTIDLKGVSVPCSVLEGDAETEYWDRAELAAKEARAKRKPQRGGRGGGRGRFKNRRT